MDQLEEQAILEHQEDLVRLDRWDLLVPQVQLVEMAWLGLLGRWEEQASKEWRDLQVLRDLEVSLAALV